MQGVEHLVPVPSPVPPCRKILNNLSSKLLQEEGNNMRDGWAVSLTPSYR